MSFHSGGQSSGSCSRPLRPAAAAKTRQALHLLFLFLSTIVPPPHSAHFGLAGNRDVAGALSLLLPLCLYYLLLRVLGSANTMQLACANARCITGKRNGWGLAAKAQRLLSACAARNDWLWSVREPWRFVRWSRAALWAARAACLFGQSNWQGAAAADGLC